MLRRDTRWLEDSIAVTYDRLYYLVSGIGALSSPDGSHVFQLHSSQDFGAFSRTYYIYFFLSRYQYVVIFRGVSFLLVALEWQNSRSCRLATYETQVSFQAVRTFPCSSTSGLTSFAENSSLEIATIVFGAINLLIAAIEVRVPHPYSPPSIELISLIGIWGVRCCICTLLYITTALH